MTSTSGTASATAAAAALAWEELVTAALLGTDRRTPPGADAGPGGARGAAGRGGRGDRTAPGGAAAGAGGGAPGARAAGPAPAAARPPRGRRLALLLADRPGTGGGGRRGTAPDLMELLPQWLAAANAHGYAAPPAGCCPRCWTRPGAVPICARRPWPSPGRAALWLARLNPDWRFALRAAPGGGAALPGPDDAERGPTAVAGGPVRRAGRPARGDTGPGRRPRRASCWRRPGRRSGPRTG